MREYPEYVMNKNPEWGKHNTHLELSKGWRLEEYPSFTRYYVSHCGYVQVTGVDIVTCTKCGSKAPDEVKGMLSMLRWGRFTPVK